MNTPNLTGICVLVDGGCYNNNRPVSERKMYGSMTVLPLNVTPYVSRPPSGEITSRTRPSGERTVTVLVCVCASDEAAAVTRTATTNLMAA